MKETYIPLDIVFLDDNRKVINIVTAQPLDSKTSYESSGPSKYVVEMNAGICQESGIVPGSTARFIIKNSYL